MGTFFAHPTKTHRDVRHWRPGLISSVSVASQTWVPWQHRAMRVIWKGDVNNLFRVFQGGRDDFPSFFRKWSWYDILVGALEQEFWMTFQKQLGISASRRIRAVPTILISEGFAAKNIEKPLMSWSNEFWFAFGRCVFLHMSTNYTFFLWVFQARHRPAKIGWGFNPTWSWPLQRRPWNESSST